jgi:hypothetical protein
VRWIAALAAVAALAGCTWRSGPPSRLDEPVQVVLRSADLQLPQAGPLLAGAVADALARDLGWRVSPGGSARLELALRSERIRTVAEDSRDVPIRWEVTLRGTAMLVSARGIQPPLPFTGTATYTGLADEQEALRRAAANAAEDLSERLGDLELR